MPTPAQGKCPPMTEMVGIYGANRQPVPPSIPYFASVEHLWFLMCETVNLFSFEYAGSNPALPTITQTL